MGLKLTNDYQIENLEGEVDFLKDKVSAHWAVDRTVANFGINIIGRVDTAEEIASQPIPEGGYKWGDAYAVGEEGSNYEYWVYTRPFAGETESHWFDIGHLSIVGPRGEQGPKGEQGPRGFKTTVFLVNTEADLDNLTTETATGDPWYTELTNLDIAITADGVAYQYFDYSKSWVSTTYNFRGPRGPQGAQGQRGEPGPSGVQGIQGIPGERGLGLVILGVKEDATFPDPRTVRRDGAYIVGDPQHLWAITGLGTGADPLVWEDLGLYTLTSSQSSSAGGKMYLHRIEYGFNDYSGGSGNFYFDLYLPTSTPLNSTTVWPYLPSTEGATMTCSGVRFNGSTYETIYAVAYLHEYEEYYTSGLYTLDPSTGYTNTVYGFGESYFNDKVYDL